MTTTASSSTGYHADGSSGTANSSEGSKRSRESMRIEEPIGPHHVQSPLPKYPLPKVRYQFGLWTIIEEVGINKYVFCFKYFPK